MTPTAKHSDREREHGHEHEHEHERDESSKDVSPAPLTPQPRTGTQGADRGSQAEVTDTPPDPGLQTVVLEQRKRSPMR